MKRKFLYVFILSTSLFGLTSCQGAPGIQGEQGIQGEKGDTGEKGETGAKGDKGDTGENGKDGIDGKDGASLLTGYGIPQNTLGNNGDTYLDLKTYDLYKKVEGEWVKEGNIKGSNGSSSQTYYSSTILPSNYGYVVPSKGCAKEGESITFKMYPFEDTYKCISLKLNDIKISADKFKTSEDGTYRYYDTKMVSGGYVVSAEFATANSVLTINTSTGGTIATKDNKTTYFIGDNVELTIKPNDNYRFKELKIGDTTIFKSQTTENNDGSYSYSTTMIEGGLTISATFETKEGVTVTDINGNQLTSGGTVTISPSSAYPGEKVKLTFAPDYENNYYFGRAIINGIDYQYNDEKTKNAFTYTLDGTFTIETVMVAGGLNVKASFTNASSWSFPRVLTLNNKEDLKKFRDLSNSKSGIFNYATIILGNDIDLENEEWIPIKNKFRGTFDGNGKTIKNLKINGNNEDNVGLFSVVGLGSDSTTIKNLIIENVNIINGKEYVGAIAGYSLGGSRFENITIKGLIQIAGQQNVGAICGGSYSSYSKCTVDGNNKNNSYIKGENGKEKSIGAIVGWLGEGSNTINECNVKNITLYGKECIGGIVGTFQSATSFVTKCNVENATINVNATSCSTIHEIYGRYVLNGNVTEPEASQLNESTYNNVDIIYKS